MEGGEPRVVHVDRELDRKVLLAAETFELFIRETETDAAFPPEC
jgi:hypothetical protein